MLFEEILVFLLAISSFFFIILPLYKFISSITPKKRNAVKEAKIRLETAKADLEAARLNKQAEEYYEKMYQEAAEEEDAANSILKK